MVSNKRKAVKVKQYWVASSSFLKKTNKKKKTQKTVNLVSAKGQPVWEKTAELRFSLSKIWIWACFVFMSAYFNKYLSLLWAIVFCVPRALAFLEVGNGFKCWTPPKLSRLWIDESAIVCFYESSSLHLWALAQSERERSSCSCWLAGVGLLSDCF